MIKVKDALTTAGKFGSATVGLTLGTIAMSNVPVIAALPASVQKILPGSLAMIIAFLIGTKFSDEYVKSAALGLGLSGFANVLKRLTDGGTGIAATINSAIPLAGLGRLGNVQSYGGYPPSYFINSSLGPTRSVSGSGYTRNGIRISNAGQPLRGLRGTSLPYQLQGPSGYLLSGVNPYQLQG